MITCKHCNIDIVFYEPYPEENLQYINGSPVGKWEHIVQLMGKPFYTYSCNVAIYIVENGSLIGASPIRGKSSTIATPPEEPDSGITIVEEV